MKSPNNKEIGPQLVISCHQTKFPVAESGYIQLCCWPKGAHEILTSPDCCLDHRLLSVNYSLNIKSLHKIFTMLPYSSDFSSRNILCMLSSIKIAEEPLIYKLSCLKNMLGQWWRKACGINQLMSECPPHKMESIPHTTRVTKNQRLDRPMSLKLG